MAFTSLSKATTLLLVLCLINRVNSGRWELRSSPFEDTYIDYQGRFLQADNITSQTNTLATNSSSQGNGTDYDIVIYGATPAGLYAGLRLLEKIGDDGTQLRADLFPSVDGIGNQTNSTEQTNLSVITVAIFEPSNRTGGRLLTGTPSSVANFLGEMGDLAYMKSNLTDFVVAYLDLETEEVPTVEDSNLLYLRGKYMRMAESAGLAQNFYALNFNERNFTPQELLKNAIQAIVPKAFSLNDTYLENDIKDVKFNGEYLYNLGFLNVLSQVLSQEGLQYVKDATSLDSYFENHNALDAIVSIVCMMKGVFRKPLQGMQAITTGLADRFLEGGGSIAYDRTLIGMDKDANVTDMLGIFGNGSGVVGNGSELIMLEFTDSSGNISEVVTARFVILALPPEEMNMLVQSSPFFEEKTVKDGLTYVRDVPNSKLYLCYDYPWWLNIGLSKGQSVTDIPTRATNYLESGCIASTVNSGAGSSYWIDMKPMSNKFSDLTVDLWGSLPANPWMIQDSQRQLKKIHSLDFIPDPITAAFADSNSVGNHQHFYKIGVNPVEVYNVSLKPLPDWNVFIIGETYAFPRKLLDSEFSSAEVVLRTFFFEPIPTSTYDQQAVLTIANRTNIGSSISTSSDGNRMAAVSYGDSGGDVTIFQKYGDSRVGEWRVVGENFATALSSESATPNAPSIKNRAASNESVVNVALSGDGNTLAFTDLLGFVQVFRDMGDGNWTSIGTDRIQNLTNSSFGVSLSLSFAGDRLAVGDPYFEEGLGRVTVYQCSLYGCQLLGSPIVGDSSGDRFGHSVSMAGRGDVVAIGAPSDPKYPGYAAVFRFKKGSWEQMGETLPYRDTGDKTSDMFGWAVSLSGDGKRLAVGAPNASGRVFVYSFDYEWKDISGDLTVRVAGKPATEIDSVGYALALSADGRYLIVGCPQIESNSSGFAMVYKYEHGMWISHGDILIGMENGEKQGFSVAISRDGSSIATGAPGMQETGSVLTYTYQEEPVSFYDELARVVWANATMNSTIDYSWDASDRCILSPELMAGYSEVTFTGPTRSPMETPSKASSAPAAAPTTGATVQPSSSGTTIAPTRSSGGTTTVPITLTNTTTQAPVSGSTLAPTTLSPASGSTLAPTTFMPSTVMPKSSRLLIDSRAYQTNVEREMQANNDTNPMTVLPENVTLTGIPPEILNNASSISPTLSPAASGTTLSPSRPSTSSPSVLGGATSVTAVAANETVDATPYYIALAEGIIAALENNITTLEVAQALLFMEGVSSKCISLVEAAKIYSSSESVPKELQNSIGDALDNFYKRVPTGAPVSVVTKAPVKVQPTKQPVKATSAPVTPTANATTSSPTAVSNNGTATSLPTTLPPVATNGTTNSSFNAVSFKVIYKGLGWVGLGVSEVGEMIGSVAVIGIPTPQGNNVSKYNLNAKDVAGVVPMDASMQTLQNVNIAQGADATVMKFETPLDWNNGVLSFSPNSNIQMIWAAGTSNDLAYHGQQNRGTFILDLSFCLDGTNADSKECKSLDATFDQMQEVTSAFTVFSKLINL